MRYFMLSLAAIVLCQSGGQKYTGPQCLGPFCMDRRTSSHDLFHKLGPPARKSGPYCYEAKEKKNGFLYFTTVHSDPGLAVQVFLSDFPNCLHMLKRVSDADLRTWKTPEGIGLGSLEKDVVRAYGKPSEEFSINPKDARAMALWIRGYRSGDRVANVGDRVLSYAGDLSQDLSTAGFGIRDGKVAWIWLSADE